jgi:hypothetical protein
MCTTALTKKLGACRVSLVEAEGDEARPPDRPNRARTRLCGSSAKDIGNVP